MPYKDKEHGKLMQSLADRRTRKALKRQICDVLGMRCVGPHCQWPDVPWFTFEIDHVNGDGAEDRAKNRSNPIAYYKHIINELRKGSGAYQLLCPTCNRWKTFENEEFCAVHPVVDGYCATV